MRGYARNGSDGFAKSIFRCTIMITGGFNNWQTERLEGKKFDRKHSKATFALFAKGKGDRRLLVTGNTGRIEKDAVSPGKPGFKPKPLPGRTFFFWTGYV